MYWCTLAPGPAARTWPKRREEEMVFDSARRFRSCEGAATVVYTVGRSYASRPSSSTKPVRSHVYQPMPHPWTFTPGGGEFSWILPTLGLWFSSLISRDDQDRTWLNGGRPNCYWMTGWFNPTGFLTAMKQEVTRKHKAEKWALDDVVYRTETTALERETNEEVISQQLRSRGDLMANWLSRGDLV